MADEGYLGDELDEDQVEEVENEEAESEEESSEQRSEEQEDLDQPDEGEDQGEEAEEEAGEVGYEIHSNGLLLKIQDEEAAVNAAVEDVPSQPPPVKAGAGAFKPLGGKTGDKIKRIAPPKSIESYLLRSPEEDNEMYRLRVDFTKRIHGLGGYSAEKSAFLGSMIAKKKRLKVKFAPGNETEIRQVLDRLK